MPTKTATTFKLGRLARSHDKRIPMLHTLLAEQSVRSPSSLPWITPRECLPTWGA